METKKENVKMKWNETEKKKLLIFALVAFGVSYLMGILLGYSYHQGNDVTAFGNVQMFYPAAGVMLGILLTAEKGTVLPKKYYYSFLVTTVIMMVTAVVTVFVPNDNWMLISQYPLILCTIVCGIMLLVEKKEVRKAYGLQFGGKKKGMSWLMVLLFFGLYILRLLISSMIAGELSEFTAIFTNPMTYIMMFSLVLSFFMAFTAFFGEEYGWRYFLQPLLQKRFGLKGGVLLLGVLWGIWHLPLNIFFYSPDTWFISVILQIITCVSFSIFFGYGYMKTGNIWVPVAMHFINNNMIPVITGSVDISGSVYRWVDVPITLLLNLVYIVFIFSGVFRKKEEASQKASVE